jgi:hypothetical protein
MGVQEQNRRHLLVFYRFLIGSEAIAVTSGGPNYSAQVVVFEGSGGSW